MPGTLAGPWIQPEAPAPLASLESHLERGKIFTLHLFLSSKLNYVNFLKRFLRDPKEDTNRNIFNVLDKLALYIIKTSVLPGLD